VRIRPALTAIATCVVAIVVALAVPVSQLRTVDVIASCCCPDPTNCHCPDHKCDPSKPTSLGQCHRTQHEIVSPDAPAFVASPVVAIASPARASLPVIDALPAPHPAPAPARPAAPS